MKAKRVFLVIVVIFFSIYLFSGPTLLRTPSVSPDGKWIAFSYGGDIFKVKVSGGEAFRITDNIAHEIFPVFSPDGKWIAFSSKRYGNYDVFYVSSLGGRPVRVTFRDTDDYVSGWLPDSKHIIFHTKWNFHYFYGNYSSYVVSIYGGTPYQLIPELSRYARVSPDFKFAVFNYGTAPELRKGYKGSANIEVYLYDLKKKAFKNISNYEGNDKWPQFCGGKIIFVSDRGKNGVFNLWEYDFKTKKMSQLTFFKEDQVRYPSCSSSGGTIAFEYRDSIYILKEGKIEKLKVLISDDYKFQEEEKIVYTKEAEIVKPSPDGKEIAFIVRGDVFVEDVESKRIRKIEGNPERSIELEWSKDSKTLYVSEDGSGNYDIYAYSSADPMNLRLSKALVFKKKRITKSSKDEKELKLSPSGKYLAFVRGKGDLVVLDLESMKEKVILRGWSTPSYSWSPDSRWIAYSREDNNFNSDVFIVSISNGKSYNISKHPDIDTNPVFSPDGTRLYFVSKRFDNNMDVWMVFLEKRVDEMDELEVEEELKKRKKDILSNKKEPIVKIDFYEIEKRVRHVTTLLGEETEVVSAFEKIYFVGSDDNGSNIYEAKWNGKDFKKITHDNLGGSYLKFDSQFKNLFFLRKNGKIAKLNILSSKVKAVPFKARVVVKRFEENRQKYDEAWRVLNEMFYDSKFHGRDWKKLHDYYMEWALNSKTIEDFNYVFTMLLGELNSSHQGIRAKRKNMVKTGYLGVYFDESFKGNGLKIERVLEYSPASREISKLFPGDIIVSVNGIRIRKRTNIYKLLEDKADEDILLGVLRNGKKVFIKIRPFSYRKLLDSIYANWVKEKRKIVESLSDGRFSYIHIRAMGTQNARDFENQLYSVAEGKDGLIIDVRNNGGGWITDLLLTMLMVKNHAITIPRDGEKGYPQGRRLLYVWTKPIVVLCNENSYSNAEIFSWSIRTLKRGAVVGEKTFGAVISTGAYTLIDGSYVRVPFRGWYVNDGSFTNMEHNGCPPHFRVPYKLGERYRGVDKQLLKAISVLEKEVERAKKDPRWPIWLEYK